MSRNSIGLFLIMTTLFACKNDDKLIMDQDFCSRQEANTFIFLGHTRGPDMNYDGTYSDIESMDFSRYNGTLLGGDLHWDTSLDDNRMNVLDGIFDFSNPSTLWAIGNHDDSNINRVKTFTGKELFYSKEIGGVMFLVLDSQTDQCSMFNAQLQMIQDVCDTIQNIQHLVLMSHKLLWMSEHPVMHDQIKTFSNADTCNIDFCIFPNNFYQDVYPFLIKARIKGVEVICLAGDMGQRSKSFQYEDEAGVRFVASGFGTATGPNMVIEFTHDPEALSSCFSYRFRTSAEILLEQ